jgi:hypothetical protein
VPIACLYGADSDKVLPDGINSGQVFTVEDYVAQCLRKIKSKRKVFAGDEQAYTGPAPGSVR